MVTKEFPKYFLRNIIGEYLSTLGEKDSRVVIVNADLSGTCRNKNFIEKFPLRSFNVGIAEQNLVSFSAGLAHEGFIPYSFSMAPFISMRACEQCRTDVAYANLPVRLIATYAGISGGISGATHWSVEDIAIMTGIPGMIVLEPSDVIQAQKMLDATLDNCSPIYIRSSVESVTNIYDNNYQFNIGEASIPRNGNDGAFICSGIVVQYALEASEIIRKELGKEIRVVDMHTIKPIDKNAIISAAKTKNIIIAQDHNIIGGLGSIVSMILLEEGISTKVKVLGFPDKFVAMAHAPFLYHKFEYYTEGLVKNMIEMLGK